MHMEVKHRLASTGATVDHRAEIVQTLLFGHAGSHQQEVAQQGRILRAQERRLSIGLRGITST